MIERRQLRIDGLSLSYLEKGRAAKDQPTLVLLHGLMGCADTFVPLMQELHPDLHLIALDLPGAGHSERRDDIDASLYTTAQLVGRFLTALICISRWFSSLPWWSGAMSLAARHCNALRSLVLLAPAHPYFHAGDPFIRFYLSLRAGCLPTPCPAS